VLPVEFGYKPFAPNFLTVNVNTTPSAGTGKFVALIAVVAAAGVANVNKSFVIVPVTAVVPVKSVAVNSFSSFFLQENNTATKPIANIDFLILFYVLFVFYFVNLCFCII